jgi:hypothetical protein
MNVTSNNNNITTSMISQQSFRTHKPKEIPTFAEEMGRMVLPAVARALQPGTPVAAAVVTYGRPASAST